MMRTRIILLLLSVFAITEMTAQTPSYKRVSYVASFPWFSNELASFWPEDSFYMNVYDDYIYTNISNGYITVSNSGFKEEYQILNKFPAPQTESDSGVELYDAKDNIGKECIVMLVKEGTAYVAMKVMYSSLKIYHFR